MSNHSLADGKILSPAPHAVNGQIGIVSESRFTHAVHEAGAGALRSGLAGQRPPPFSTALTFFEGVRSERLPANLLQAQRDLIRSPSARSQCRGFRLWRNSFRGCPRRSSLRRPHLPARGRRPRHPAAPHQLDRRRRKGCQQHLHGVTPWRRLGRAPLIRLPEMRRSAETPLRRFGTGFGPRFLLFSKDRVRCGPHWLCRRASDGLPADLELSAYPQRDDLTETGQGLPGPRIHAPSALHAPGIDVNPAA